jgi:hypothetical protein
VMRVAKRSNSINGKDVVGNTSKKYVRKRILTICSMKKKNSRCLSRIQMNLEESKTSKKNCKV